MHSWNMGYDTETIYDFGYFSFLNLYQTRFKFISQGVAFPEIGPDFNACELGFGNGVSIVMHAVNSPAQWYGNDFNPSQVYFAQKMADSAKVKLHLTDDAFDQYLKRDDLPMFDFICLHGIWSWISEENQDIIVEFIKRHLKIGGVVYLSYNIGAGFGSIEPFRYLLRSYVQTLGDPALPNVHNLPAAFEFIDKLMELNPGYLKYSPWIKDIYKERIYNKERNYVSHEYLNTFWSLLNFNDVAAKLEPAKLNFVCQARAIDDLDEFYLKDNEMEFLKPFANTQLLYQSIRDYIGFQTFRCDLYVKGLRPLNFQQQLDELDKTYFIWVQDPSFNDFHIDTRLGSIKVDLERLKGIKLVLSDLNCHSYRQLRMTLCKEYATKAPQGIKLVSAQQLLDDVIYAVSVGMILITVPPEQISDEIIAQAQALNNEILNNTFPANIQALNSPVLGGGLAIEDIHKFLLRLVLKYPQLNEEELAKLILNMQEKDASLLKFQLNGQETNNKQSQQDILKDFVHSFMVFRVPILRKLCFL